MYACSRETPPAAARYPARQAQTPAAGIFVSRLQMARFRNYPFLRLDLPPEAGQVVLTGKNGCGKTNLLEAVSFLAPGKGLRHAGFRDILPKTETAGSWGITAVLRKGNEEIDVTTDYENVSGRRTEKRRVRLNGAAISQADLGQVCSAVWLTPAMDRLFAGEPAGRRRFLDRLTQTFFEEHARACAAYGQALRQWGALIREGKTDERWLSALEKTMGKYGAKTALARRTAVSWLRAELERETTVFPRALLSLQGGGEDELAAMPEEEAAEFIRARFSRSRDIYAQNGSAGGIHTVDLAAGHREKNMPAAACSTGEQKALLISVLLAHIRVQAGRKGALPLVLFDEVTAHLDDRRRDALFDEISALKTQAWLTGTTPRPFEGLKKTAHFIAVDELLRTVPDWAAAS